MCLLHRYIHRSLFSGRLWRNLLQEEKSWVSLRKTSGNVKKTLVGHASVENGVHSKMSFLEKIRKIFRFQWERLVLHASLVKFSLGGFGSKGRYPTYRFSYQNSQKPSTKTKKSQEETVLPHGFLAALDTLKSSWARTWNLFWLPFFFGILPPKKPVTFSPAFRCELVPNTLGSGVKIRTNRLTIKMQAGL